MKIFIISAWSCHLYVDDNGNLNTNSKQLAQLEYYGEISEPMICNYLSPYIYGVKTTGKEIAINNLSKINVRHRHSWR